jgi:phosphoribosyl-AMP cyclohydrolase
MHTSLPALLERLVFNAHGLIPAVVQDSTSHQVLMHAWMNKEAITKTLATGDVTYWSRSRNELWRKGATSGHTQKLVKFYVDCDADTLLITVQQIGAACHTGAMSCFFKEVVLTAMV